MTRSLDQALLQGADVSALASMNLLVNGFMVVSQENGAAVVTGPGRWPADQICTVGAASLSAQQVTSPFPSQPDIPFGVKMTAPSVVTLSTTDAIMFYQPIEGSNLTRLRYGAANARPVTIAFQLRPSYSGPAGFSLINVANSSALRSAVHRLDLVANQDNFFCFTMPGDQAAALLTNNVASLQARWCFGAGTSLQTTAMDTWAAGNLAGPPDITNMGAVAGNNIVLSGTVMLPGIVPITQAMLPLLARPYDDELRKCERYFSRRFYTMQNNIAYLVQRHRVSMRSTPTVTLSSGSLNGGTVDTYSQDDWRQGTASSGFSDVTLQFNARM